MQAIETVYHGYRFRSRLEARWAVFFDALDIPYEYELEGFQFEDGTRYLPDFWLPEQKLWCEIKPMTLHKIEEHKAQALAEGTGHRVAVLIGSPTVIEDDIGISYDEIYPHETYMPFWDNQAQTWYVGWDNHHQWCECRHCGLIGFQFEARSHRLPCNCVNDNDRGHNGHSERLRTAALAARAARFEFLR